MSRIISELLQASQPHFAITVEQLERASGHPAEDVALTADILQMSHMKIRALGLDPRDCTGAELYRSLSDLVIMHDGFLARRIGIVNPESVSETTTKVVAYVKNMDTPKEVWVLRHAAAKQLLKSLPPKRLMKHLGYRSADSMLKRENIADIIGASLLLESEQWRRAYAKQCRMLSPLHFETRDIEIRHLSGKKWQSVAAELTSARRHTILTVEILGVVLVLPLPFEKMRIVTILTMSLLLHYMGELRAVSSHLRSLQVHADFGNKVAQVSLQSEPLSLQVGDHEFKWATLHRYFGSFERKHHPEVFEPHIQPEDLRWLNTEETLYRIEPALHFWFNTNHVGVMRDGRPVSFHLLDVIVSTLNNLKYGYQVTHHMRESLWNELLIRYCKFAPIESQILKKLEGQSLQTELLILNSGRRT